MLEAPAHKAPGVGYHHPPVEDGVHAFAGANSGPERLGDACGGFAGLAVDADWTTTEDEWREFGRHFRDR